MITGGAKYPIALCDASAAAACTSAMARPMRAATPGRSCLRSHT
jgi:hypothetical protein